jgi:dCMP deaminase
MRPTLDDWALELVKVTAKRGTCYRRQVGCVLLNDRGHVLSTGYNGVAMGLPHCNQHNPLDHEELQFLCKGAHAMSGTSLNDCQAIHAEQNALLQCRDVFSIATCYVSASPCITCTKLLLNTSCQRIVYLEPYSHNEARQLWEKADRAWVHMGRKRLF